MKNVFIFGDSYSAFEGWVPEGHELHYYIGREECDVKTVEDMWWYPLLPEIGGSLVLNDSWSGSTIGYTGYFNADCSETNSFIYRFERHLKNGFFEKNKIDTMFVLGGTNDSWCGAEKGEMMYENHTKEDLFKVLPAICYFFKRVSEELKDTKIVCIINSELDPVTTDGLKTAAERYGAQVIQLHDIDKFNSHPTALGMKAIKDQVLEALK